MTFVVIIHVFIYFIAIWQVLSVKKIINQTQMKKKKFGPPQR